MNFFVWGAVVACIMSGAVAVTITTYNDGVCSTPKSTSQALPNPWISPIGACTKYQSVAVGQVTVDLFLRLTACASTSGSIQGKFSGVLYGDPGCSGRVTQNADLIGDTDRCVNMSAAGSQKIECAASSSASLGLLVIATAALALLI
jgi:hypothetical protein